MPYFRRVPLLNNSLVSYHHHYRGRKDWEVVIAEDVKNLEYPGEHESLLNLLNKFKDRISITHFVTSVRAFNPAPYFNEAFKASKGEFIVITNPEGVHFANVLQGLDVEFAKDKNSYVVCSCMNGHPNATVNRFEDYKFQDASWFQHSVRRNGLIHFCSAISRENYEKLGGYDEEFGQGISCEDVDWIERIKLSDLKIVTRDDLVTHHQSHEQVNTTPANKELHKRNWDLCVKKGWYKAK
jgi:GT2 family glycosyltransferase